MALDEHAQRGLAPGSFHWYAVLFAPAELRSALTALHGVAAEIRETVTGRIEHEVAHVKLAWWRAELERLQQGTPVHPLTRQLQRFDLRPEDLQDLLTAADLDLACQTYAASTELDRYLDCSGGALQRLGTQVTATADCDWQRLASFGSALGQAVRAIEILRDVAVDRHQGRLYLPLDGLDRAGLTPDNMLDIGNRRALTECLQPLAQRARRSLDLALSILTPVEQRAQRPGMVLGALHAAQLQHLERTGLAAVETQRQLPPFKRLVNAWRAARRT